MAYTRQTFRINDTELIFTHTIYVSPDGNDTTGDGSNGKPYKTIQKATSRLTNDTTAIVLLPGVYNEDPYLNPTLNTNGNIIYYTSQTVGGEQRLPAPGVTKAVFTSLDYTAYFFGYGNDTVINTTFATSGCSVVAVGKNKNVYLYNVVVNVNCTSPAAPDSNVFIAGEPETKQSYVYNCTFNYVSTFTTRRGVYLGGINCGPHYAYNCVFNMGDVSNACIGSKHARLMKSLAITAYQNYYGTPIFGSWGAFAPFTDTNEPRMVVPLNAVNCMFINLQDWTSVHSGGTTGSGAFVNATNCIYPNITGSYENLTATNSIKDDVKLDSESYPLQTNAWRNTGITSIKDIDTQRSSIGVYGGPYTWNRVVSQPATISIDNFQKIIDKDSDNEYGFTINPPNSVSMVKLEETFSGNFIDNSSIAYSYQIDNRTWARTDRIEIL